MHFHSVAMSRWLTVIGIGEDGLDGLPKSSQKLIFDAEVLVGGVRHLTKIPSSGALRVSWGENLIKTIKTLIKYKTKKIVILASGDPLEFGVGSSLVRAYSPSEIRIIPHQSAFSLAASRMCWPLPDVYKTTLHGRPLDSLNYLIYPNSRILILSRDRQTPKQLADHLSSIGYGKSHLSIFENLDGDCERKTFVKAQDTIFDEFADLNTIALECFADIGAVSWSRLAGLPEAAYENNGNITKREVRAITLAALSPLPGQTLWDIGAGTGAIGIEWLRASAKCEAIAIEGNFEKCKLIERNATKLGVPRLKVFNCLAPEGFPKFKTIPDAIFIGGSVSNQKLLQFAWDHLSKNGRLVANAVTVQAQKALMIFQSEFGGEFTRVSISRSDSIGEMLTLRPMMDVLQLKVLKF